MQGLNWEFVVIADEQENAFVVPGGKVVVFTGLLKLLETEAELAAVLSHEVAHVLARHVVTQHPLCIHSLCPLAQLLSCVCKFLDLGRA